jgi:D-erythronate 2-dehydrogenase
LKIVLTGAGGFVGSALRRQLIGHNVVAVDSDLRGAPGIEGNLCDHETLARAFSGGCDAVVHLATVPGGAAEANPALAKQVNVDATMALVDAAVSAGTRPRFIFASSIAVLGDQLTSHVDDASPLFPRMVYGAHKAMMEQWIATQSRRGAISGLALRLPGIVARPRAHSGMKSAFMSDVFHAFAAREAIDLPVSRGATMWLMSVDRVAANLSHALSIDATGSVTLPALRVSMGALVTTIAEATGADPALATYNPDPSIEAGFGRQPALTTPAADALGFTHDDSLAALVASALGSLV